LKFIVIVYLFLKFYLIIDQHPILMAALFWFPN
jgi:hypothetical protein